VIRDAVPSDAPVLADLYGQLLGRPPKVSAVEDTLGAVAETPETRILVSLAGKRLVGTLQATYYRSPLRPAVGKGIIDAVIVDEGSRGRGIGTALIESASRWLESTGVSPIFVATREDRTAAHALYDSLGWARWGVTYARFTEPGGGRAS